jgi:undecaprenol kinase
MIKFGRLLKSFNYALRGLVKTFREEQNLRLQAIAGLIILILAFYYQVARWEWLILILIISLVILMEIINSAVERVTDVLKPRLNGYVKEIKDIMAAAVVVASIVSIIMGLVIFWPYFFPG